MNNSQPWHFPGSNINFIMDKEKIPYPNTAPQFKLTEGSAKYTLDSNIIFADDEPTLYPMRYIAGGKPTCVESYTAAFLICQTRVRGIDYCPVARKLKYKVDIPAGWHENVIDPNYPLSDHKKGNKHVAIPDFNPTDLQSFHALCSEVWNIRIDKRDILL